VPTSKPTAELASHLLELIKHQQNHSDEPLFVALDGRSGSGKSTLANYIANRIPSVTVIEGDDFYTGGDFNLWSSRTAGENAEHCIDWKKQRNVISALKSDLHASWYAFDWHSKQWATNKPPYCSAESTCSIAAVVLLEGVYSARKELSSLFNLRVMLDVPNQIREQQLIAREGESLRPKWDQLWSEAEQYYFDNNLDYHSLHLVLS